MRDVIDGVETFRTRVFPAHRVLFDQLAQGQSPTVMFVACSDSRVDPNLITQSPPGALFVLRNAGNIVPTYQMGAESATIEYAVEKLGVDHIVVCGHSDCGAIGGLIQGVDGAEHPAIAHWLKHAADVLERVQDTHGEASAETQVHVGVHYNVQQQVLNLKTHPSVARAIQDGRLALHAWVYDIGTGEVMAHRAVENDFVPVEQLPFATEVLDGSTTPVPTQAGPQERVLHGPCRAVLHTVADNRHQETVDALQGLLGCTADQAADRLRALPSELMVGITADEGQIVLEWMAEVGASVLLER